MWKEIFTNSKHVHTVPCHGLKDEVLKLSFLSILGLVTLYNVIQQHSSQLMILVYVLLNKLISVTFLYLRGGDLNVFL